MMKNIRLQYASWDQLTPDFQAFFHFMLGADTARGRAFYELYFLWFSIPHEIAHVLREQYGRTDASHWVDENAATTFAVEYWRQRGETQRLGQLRAMLKGILQHLPNPVPPEMDRGEFFDARYDKLVRSASSFSQLLFSIALHAIESPLPWVDTVRSLINPLATSADTPPVGPYAAINPDLPRQIIEDMREFLHPFGITVPPIEIACEFGYQLQFVTWEP
jgi:hypothetical protein